LTKWSRRHEGKKVRGLKKKRCFKKNRQGKRLRQTKKRPGNPGSPGNPSRGGGSSPRKSVANFPRQKKGHRGILKGRVGAENCNPKGTERRTRGLYGVGVPRGEKDYPTMKGKVRGVKGRRSSMK